MRVKPFYLVMVLVGLVMGIMLSFQFRVTREIMKTPQVSRVQSVAARVAEAREEHEKKQEQVKSMRADLDKIAADTELGALKEDLERARIEAGLNAVTGPGVEVTLNDSNVPVKPGENPNMYVLHDEDILRVLNELRAAGAEALAINGQRLLATSEIRCTGPTILINKNHRLTPPFVISAVGNQDNLVNSLKMRSGVLEYLQAFGIQASVRKVSQVDIPAYSGVISFDYARPAAEVQKSQ
ncbi:MAG: DUF881 domain-containing protein [Peptococcaceae bacterium]|nr:DUF881 domain-containing protein [Peptococcaceae bacterium]